MQIAQVKTGVGENGRYMSPQVSPDQLELMRNQGYCTAFEAAEALGVHITSVYRAVERNAYRGVKIGRNHYVEVESLANYAVGDDPRMFLALPTLCKLVVSDAQRRHRPLPRGLARLLKEEAEGTGAKP